MKITIRLFSTILIVASMSSCASLFDGTTQQVNFFSEPSGATVKDNNTGAFVCRTPCSVEVRRSNIRMFTFEKDGYSPSVQMLTGSFNPNVVWNVFIGGIPGIIIDYASGAAWKYNYPNVYNEWEKKEDRKEEEKKEKKGGYVLALTKVEKPANAQIEFGEIETKEVETKYEYQYVDNYIDIRWFPNSTNFKFVLSNNSPYSMKVLWDEAVYVDESGMSDKVIHEGTKLIDRNNSQAPTTVLRDAKISDLLAPVGKIYYDDYSTYDKGWKHRPLFSDKRSLDNKTVRVSLPLQIQNVTNEYIFTFTIKYVHPE